MFIVVNNYWHTSKTVCGGFNSKLAEPMNTNTSHFLISHSQIMGGIFWIGISDIIQEGKWIYSTGQIPIKVNNFQPGEPNAGTAANCVALWAAYYGYWADENCLARYRFICCKNGWTQFGNKCYFFSHQVEPWSEAMSVCRVFDSKLAEPMTSDESNYIISQSQKVGGSFWIGISDIIDEDRWIYSTGQEPIKVNNFQPGEPNSHTSANCVVLYGPFRGKWADDNCITLHQFVCETNNE
ncbi:CD206 [Mytilus edulis]|uniref:MRC n=1 Tax=Mytilus edulis TaxID=6550 RepID=A0A8S3R858_MYTED|nr:CD206 [Mytilus edulis]